MKEECTNGRGLAALTPHSSHPHSVELGYSHRSDPVMPPLGWQNLSSLPGGPRWLLSVYGTLQNSDSVPFLAVEITAEIPMGNCSEVGQHLRGSNNRPGAPAAHRDALNRPGKGRPVRETPFCGFTLKGQLCYFAMQRAQNPAKVIKRPGVIRSHRDNPPCTWQRDSL